MTSKLCDGILSMHMLVAFDCSLPCYFMRDPSFKVTTIIVFILLTVFFERSYYQASLSSVSELCVRVSTDQLANNLIFR